MSTLTVNSTTTALAGAPDTMVLAALEWDRLGDTFIQAIYDTLTMVLALSLIHI